MLYHIKYKIDSMRKSKLRKKLILEASLTSDPDVIESAKTRLGLLESLWYQDYMLLYGNIK